MFINTVRRPHRHKSRFFVFLLLVCQLGSAAASDLILTGVIDGPLTGGIPKAIEFFVVNDIADLSDYGFGSANNGGGSDGEEFSFPAVAASAGDFIYVASETTAFTTFFGFAPDYTSGAASINGDDAIELFESSVVVDVFGDINVDGNGEPWEYLDGWAYRNDGTGPDGSVFVLANWSFSGPNALDGETINGTASSPFPIGTFGGTGGTDSAPMVVTTSPADSATGVPVNTAIDISFSEAVTVTGSAFTISCTASSDHTATVSGGPQTYTLTPDSGFDNSETCTVTVVADQVSDDDTDDPPDNMVENFVFSFDTEAPASIIINEILQNPSAVSDGNGEWFELYNATDTAIDIDGWTIEDNDSDDFVINNGGPLNVPAGGFVVFSNNGDFASNGGVNVDYEYSGMFLSNGSDELVVRDGSLAEIDRVEWDNGATFPDPTGASMSLIVPALDNNVGANWCEATTPYGDGDLGTPGAVNDCPLPEIIIVINEIIQNPAAVSDSNGEWFELFNPTSAELDINGWTIKDDGSNSHVIDNSGPLNVPAGGFVVLGRNADSVINGGVSLDYAYGSAFTLANGDDEVILLDLALNEVDRVNYDGGSDFPDPNGASMSLIVPGMDNNLGESWCTATTAFGDGDFGTPGAENDCGAQEIFTIQGAGGSSPFDGFNATTEDNSVTAVGADGFFMQTPTARTDANIDTSDGIWVFTNGDPGVAVGDRVDVSGPIREFFGFTEFSSPTVTPNGTGVVPAAVVLNAVVPSDDPTSPSCAIELECYEGMFVSLPEGLVVGGTQTFGSDPVAEVHVVGDATRPFRETGVAFPGLGGGIPTWDGNPEVFEVDPDKLGFANVTLPAGSTLAAMGGLGYEFGGYEIWASADVVVKTTADPVAAVRSPVTGEMTVGSLNMLNLFSSAGDFNNRIAKLSNYVRNVLGSPDILAVQEVGSISELTTLANSINGSDPAVGYVPFLVDSNSNINVGFLVGADVDTDAITQLGADELLVFDGNTLHDRPPLLFEGRYTDNGLDFPLAVMVVHMRSLIGIDTTGDGDRVRNKRLEQAQSIATKAQDYQVANPGTPFIIVGDFNAFEFTDGYVDVIGQMKGDFDPAQNLLSGPDLVDPNLVNQVDDVAADQRYSFVFQGNAQVLDHALTNTVADKFARGLQFGRGNADAIHGSINDIGTVNRSSDHDGLVLYMMTDFDGDGFPDDEDLCPFAPGDVADQPNNTALLNGCAISIPATDYRGLMVLMLLLMTLGAATIRRNAR